MPQARSSGSAQSSSGTGRSQTRRSSASRSTGTRRTTRSTGSSGTRSRASRSTGAASASQSAAAGAAQAASATDTQLEAVAARVRRLNERIIEAGKEAGEMTLSSYERALKAIASSLERGPGQSEVDWISSLATTQAKFIRDVTNAWTSAARGMLK